MDCVQQFLHARVADLTVARGIFTKALHSKALPDWNDVPMDAVYTTLGAMVLVQVLVAMLTSKGRRLVLDTIETILAIGLILILLVGALCWWGLGAAGAPPVQSLLG